MFLRGSLIPIMVLASVVATAAEVASAPEHRVRPGEVYETVVLEDHASVTPFPHFWEEMFGSGRAILALRQDYLQDAKEVQKVTKFRYVRFHGILDDEVGVYIQRRRQPLEYNFSYVDQIYDGLLALGIRPFVEISFMPEALASNPNTLHPFWYHPNVSPPKDYTGWDNLIRAFAQHLVDRYGINEVSQWYFEVWNEPNIDFWQGVPKQATYFDLYAHTARTLKEVSPRLRVGGPATAQTAWVSQFIAWCIQNHVPIDFISSHIYGDEKPTHVFGKDFAGTISKDEMVYLGVKKLHDEIVASAQPTLPLFISEFNAGFKNLGSRDTLYVGPFLANTIRQCDGLAKMMSFWTFSDIIEEQGPPRTPFHGSFGLFTYDGIPKPSFVDFELLHKLGDERLANSADDVIVTKTSSGRMVLAAWNLVDPGTADSTKTIHFDLKNLNVTSASILRVDRKHSDTLALYRKMGSPQYPTSVQIRSLSEDSRLMPPEIVPIRQHGFDVVLPSNALTIITLK